MITRRSRWSARSLRPSSRSRLRSREFSVELPSKTARILTLTEYSRLLNWSPDLKCSVLREICPSSCELNDLTSSLSTRFSVRWTKLTLASMV